MNLRAITSAIFLTVLSISSAHAQSFEAAAHVSAARWSEFEGTDWGVGGRLTWKPISIIGVEAELTLYPSDFSPAAPAFSRQRLEGLFGVTIGPRIDGVRLFARLAAGFLDVGPTNGAFACIAIFPPPLPCLLAGGATMPAYEIGGGVVVDATSRVFVRADLADRILKYPGPTLRADFTRNDEGFLGHALRLTFATGVRF
jgi:hypothetical protein